MERPIEPGSRSRRPRKNQILLLAAVLVAVSSWMVFLSWRASRTETVRRQLSCFALSEHPAGGEISRGCRVCRLPREEQRNLPPASDGPLPRSDRGRPHVRRATWEPAGLSSRVKASNTPIELRDGHVFHQETRRDASGRIVTRSEAEVQFVVGSGRQGTSYLIDHDGFLFESPLTWYSRKQQWDLSPGFEVFNYHFDRPIQPQLPVLPREPGRADGRPDQPISTADLPGSRNRL